MVSSLLLLLPLLSILPGTHSSSLAQDADAETVAVELRAMVAQAREALAVGDYELARQRILAAIDRVLLVMDDQLEAGHELLHAIGRLAIEVEELQGANRLWVAAVDAGERILPEEHPFLLAARGNLAGTLLQLGDPHGARALLESVLDVYSRTLPEEDSDLQRVRGNLAGALLQLGDLSRARALLESVLEVFSRTLPDEHLLLQAARMNLASALSELGDLPRARMLYGEALEVYARTLPDVHPHLQAARVNLAMTLSELGDLHGARALQESSLEVLSQILPEESLDLQKARGNLAMTLHQLGDLHGARVLVESVLEVLSRTLPEEHPTLHATRANLAATLSLLGDLPGVRALQESTLEFCSRALPEEHLDLQKARMNLASTLHLLGDHRGARALQESALEVCSRVLPEEHLVLQMARANLASMLRQAGDLHGARLLEESVLEVRSRTLSEEDPELQAARGNLATTNRLLAATAAWREERVEGAWSASEKHAEVGWNRAVELTAAAVRGALADAQATLAAASVREAEERLGAGSGWPLNSGLSTAAGCGLFEPVPALLLDAFQLSEATRAAGLASASIARMDIDPSERARLREDVRLASAELAALVQIGGTPQAYHLARQRREVAERALVALGFETAHAECGALRVSAHSLADAIDETRALVGLRRYTRAWCEALDSETEPGSGVQELALESVGAFLLGKGGGDLRLAFVDLGPVGRIESLVDAWREAIRATPERGIGLDGEREDPASAAGQRLRSAVWDPLLPHLEDAERVVVALDDVLHLVPFDSLPLDEGAGLVGDRWRVETRLALWELLDAPRPTSGRTALVSLGGAAFNSEPEGLSARDVAALQPKEEIEPQEEDDELAVAGDTEFALLRGGAWERGFEPLAYTRKEAIGLAELFEEIFGEAAPALVLDRRRASRQALEEAAPRARFLHVATHGWFAPESIRSWADTKASERESALALRLDMEATVRGMNPMLLCGLALAGANLPADSLGRVPGLMTAEELSSLDLTGCELAVLSACDTNVGERRAGQGVASLQKALHMAGARSVITSLWKVPDEATADLMLDFYRRLWVEQKPKHQALWEAKLRLRNATDERGQLLYTTRDWAAWVLTGEPD